MQTLEELSYKHYNEWLEFSNEQDSPKTWLLGSFATVRGLLRIPHEQGHPEITKSLLEVLKKALEQFEASLASPTK